MVFPLSSYYSYSISISRYEVKDEQEAAHIFNQVPAMQVSFHVEEIVLPSVKVISIFLRFAARGGGRGGGGRDLGRCRCRGATITYSVGGCRRCCSRV